MKIQWGNITVAQDPYSFSYDYSSDFSSSFADFITEAFPGILMDQDSLV